MDTVIKKFETSLWGFKESDIITSERTKSAWNSQKVLITDFDTKENRIFGQILREGSTSGFKCSCSDPEGIILLERPEYKFRVGDGVKNIYIPNLKNKFGRVIVINPEKDCKEPFYVEFPGLKFVGSGMDKPWFPRERHPAFRIWCKEEHLEITE